MAKKLYPLFGLLIIAAMLLAACGGAATTEAPPPPTEAPAPTDAPAPTEPPAATEPPEAMFKACQVTDVGGIDDKSFNATAWKGVQDAMADFGIDGAYLESQQQTDYEKNIKAFIDEGCNIIVTVGFLLGDATAVAANANPDVPFSIIDFAYDPTIPNVAGQVFNTDEAAFLAGYVAAGTTQTGKVATFGGIQIPPVTIFMDGFYAGVMYYNAQKGTSVEVLGWDPAAQTGSFTGNFESKEDGRTLGLAFMDEGADIIMPVAGPVGEGTAAAAQERGNVYIVGVDSDWFNTVPDFQDIVLTSVLKNMDITTYQSIEFVIDGSFEGGLIIGTLENGGVGLAPFHNMESMVPSELVAELEDVKAAIIAGDISVKPGDAMAMPPKVEAPEGFKACQVTDVGGIDDKSFNATAWKGVQDAMTDFGIEGAYLESQQQTDYEKNIKAFVDEGCNIIVTVGFLLGDATAVGAAANPDVPFSIIDFAYDPTIPNVAGQVFNTDEAAFLAGYVAAGTTQTGKVATFGGIQIPPVTIFMDGFYAGVMYYNAQKGTSVEVLGWDPAAQTGSFTGNFESKEDGRTLGLAFMDEGADIIMPVAGPVGEGTAAAAQERGNVYIVGVDSDWFNTVPDFQDIVLTSVLKNMDITTYQSIESVIDGSFEGGLIIGTLENGGVGLAPFHNMESMVPSELVAELEDVKAAIIAGDISVKP